VFRRTLAAVALLLAAGAAVAVLQPGLLVGDYERTTVTIEDGDTGERLATVDARVADTALKRYVGLSATDSLAADEGMLFVHEAPGERAYVMRGMAFGLDIVFVAADGEITRIHEAGPDADGRFEGRGRYVLEVRRGYTDDRGIETGDRVVVDL